MHGWPSFLGRRKWVSSRIVYICTPNCCEMSVFGSYWRLDNLCSVNKLARAVTNLTKACDKRLALLISYLFLQVNTSNIVMWETQHNNADLDCFKTLILQETLKTQNQHQENFVFFRKSHVCANKLDVQETDFRFTQFYRSWNHFSSMQVYAWTGFPLSIFGTWWWKHFIAHRTRLMYPRESHGETCLQLSSQTCMLYVFWGTMRQ